MPELPEVETTRRGIEKHVCDRRITAVLVRQPRLRWPISDEVNRLAGRRIERVDRRGKYLLMRLDLGCLIWHLGMSGSMRILPVNAPVGDHEHVELQLDSGLAIKYRDPRRFGALLYTPGEPLEHRLLRDLGPEPLGEEFTAGYLHRACRGRSSAIKTLLMNSHLVVGVGNIYASEALYRAGIRPTIAARRLSKPRITALVAAIRDTLANAIAQGGTTLRDFTRVDGKPGYFRNELMVYGVAGDCPRCGVAIRQIRQAQRATYYCPGCQK